MGSSDSPEEREEPDGLVTGRLRQNRAVHVEEAGASPLEETVYQLIVVRMTHLLSQRV